MTFETWYARVSNICENRFDVSPEDLPDMLYADWFDDGYTPMEAVELIAEELGEY